MSVKSFNFYKLIGFMFKLVSLEMMEIFSHFQQLRFVENRFIIEGNGRITIIILFEVLSKTSSIFSAKDENEVALFIKDLNSPGFYPSMVSIWVTDSFERKDKEMDMLAKLLVNLTKSRDAMLSQVQLIKG